MKTAISLPDDLFKKIEKIASKLGIPRSQIYAKALEEYIDNHRIDHVTEKLNEIYGHEKSLSSADQTTLDAGIQALRDATKNDSW